MSDLLTPAPPTPPSATVPPAITASAPTLRSLLETALTSLQHSMQPLLSGVLVAAVVVLGLQTLFSYLFFGSWSPMAMSSSAILQQMQQFAGTTLPSAPGDIAALRSSASHFKNSFHSSHSSA